MDVERVADAMVEAGRKWERGDRKDMLHVAYAKAAMRATLLMAAEVIMDRYNLWESAEEIADWLKEQADAD